MARAKTNNNAVSNEEIIAALLQHGTIREAAAAAGIATRTLYDRMQDREFNAEYMQAKNDIMRKAVFNMNEKLAAAVDCIADIMQDEKANPAVRLQAAQTILNNAGKYAEALQKQERAANSEAQDPLDIFGTLLGK